MGYGSFFRAYRDAARDKHRSLPQIALGISRALEALVAGDLTPNSVGLRIKELEDAGLLKRYLGAAFKAESLLLR
jgi:DNA-binding Lrp family transcriptional regulator